MKLSTSCILLHSLDGTEAWDENIYSHGWTEIKISTTEVIVHEPHTVRRLGEDPGERYLAWNRLVLVRDRFDVVRDHYILVEALLGEARHHETEVVRTKVGSRFVAEFPPCQTADRLSVVDLEKNAPARDHTPSERTVSNNSHAQLLCDLPKS